MEFRQIQYLLAVVDEGSFTKAAVHLNVAQSAISHQVSKLEDEVGVTLLRRERPRVTASPEGEAFINRMRRVVAELGSAVAEARSLKGMTVGRVAFGVTFPAASLDVPRMLSTFRETHPGVTVSLREGTRTELLEMLRLDVIDLAVVSAEIDTLPSGIEGVIFDKDELVLVGPAGHPLEKMNEVQLSALEGVDRVGFRRGAGVAAAAESALALYGVSSGVIIESNDKGMLLELVTQGIGLAILPKVTVDPRRSGIWSRPLDPPLSSSVLLVWRGARRYPPATEQFLRFVLSAVSGPQT